VAWKYLQSWCEHNLRILSYLQTATRPYIVLDYHRLVTTQAEFDRFQQFLGMPLVDRRRPSLYRNRPQSYAMLSLAEWFLGKQKGYQPQAILRQFEDYRQ
jgi:hypothetical protein